MRLTTISLPKDVVLTALLDARDRSEEVASWLHHTPSRSVLSILERLDEADRQLAVLEAALGYKAIMRRVPRHRALVPLQAA